jgi:predicted Zn-dependent peptidase
VAKGYLRAEMLLSGEDSGARMSRIGAAMLLHGKVQTVDEILRHIDAVDAAQVRDAAAALATSPRTMSAVGPFDERDFESHLPAMAGR